MFTLKNDSLYVSVLDPVADRGRLGSRYCTGCYIWQVTDMRLGELLSGPAYPDPAPPVFDGQGAPDAFERALGHESARVGDEVLVIGVGKVLRSSGITPFHSRHNPQVTCFCEWNIIQGSDSITMRTSQEFGEWSFNIIRSLILKDRILRLVSMIESSGNTEIPIRWFAHPFFPHTESMRCCSFSLPVKLPGNPGFMLDSEGFVNT